MDHAHDVTCHEPDHRDPPVCDMADVPRKILMADLTTAAEAIARICRGWARMPDYAEIRLPTLAADEIELLASLPGAMRVQDCRDGEHMVITVTARVEQVPVKGYLVRPLTAGERESWTTLHGAAVR